MSKSSSESEGMTHVFLPSGGVLMSGFLSIDGVLNGDLLGLVGFFED